MQNQDSGDDEPRPAPTAGGQYPPTPETDPIGRSAATEALDGSARDPSTRRPPPLTMHPPPGVTPLGTSPSQRRGSVHPPDHSPARRERAPSRVQHRSHRPGTPGHGPHAHGLQTSSPTILSGPHMSGLQGSGLGDGGSGLHGGGTDEVVLSPLGWTGPNPPAFPPMYRPGKFVDTMAVHLRRKETVGATEMPRDKGARDMSAPGSHARDPLVLEPLYDPRDDRRDLDDLGAHDQNRNAYLSSGAGADDNEEEAESAAGQMTASALPDYLDRTAWATVRALLNSDHGHDESSSEEEDEGLDGMDESRAELRRNAAADDKRIPVAFILQQLDERAQQRGLTRDLMLYFPFLMFFLIFFYGGRDTEGAFYIAGGYDGLLTGNEFPSTHPYTAYVESGYVWPPTDAGTAAAEMMGPMWDKAYGDIDASVDWFDWLEGVGVPYLWGRNNEFRQEQNEATVVATGTGSNFLIGKMRIRAYHVPNDSCIVDITQVPKSTDAWFMLPEVYNTHRCKGTPAPTALSTLAEVGSEFSCATHCNTNAACTASTYRAADKLCELFEESPCVPFYDLQSGDLRLKSNQPLPEDPAKSPDRTLPITYMYGKYTDYCWGKYTKALAEANPLGRAFGPVGDTQRYKLRPCNDMVGRTIDGKVLNTAYACGGYTYSIPFNISFEDAMNHAFKMRGDADQNLHPGAPRVPLLDDGLSCRFIVAEFFSYTNSLNYFTAVKLYTEIATGGAWVPSIMVRNFKVWTDPEDIPKTVFDAFFMLMVCCYVGKFFYEWKEYAADPKNIGTGGSSPGLGYILQAWNVLEFFNLMTFLVVFGFKIAWMAKSSKVSFKLPRHDLTDEAYDELDKIMWIYMTTLYINSFNGILCFVKVLKYVKLNDRFNILSRTMEASLQNLVGIMIIFFIIIFAYSVTGNTLFGNGIEEYRSLSDSLTANLRLLLGDFDYEELREENLTMAGLYFWSFVIIGLFLLLNFIIAVLSDAFDEKMNETRAPSIEEMVIRTWEKCKRVVVRWIHNPIGRLQAMFIQPDEEKLTSALLLKYAEYWLLEEIGKVSGDLFPEKPTNTEADKPGQTEDWDKFLKWKQNEFGFLVEKISQDSDLNEKYSLNYNDLKREILEKLWLGPMHDYDAETIEVREDALCMKCTDHIDNFGGEEEEDDAPADDDDVYPMIPFQRAPDERFISDGRKGTQMEHVLGLAARGLGPRPVKLVDADGETHSLEMFYEEGQREGVLHHYLGDSDVPDVVDSNVFWNDAKHAKRLVLYRKQTAEEKEAEKRKDDGDPTADRIVAKVQFPKENCKMRVLVPILRKVLNLCVGPLGSDIAFTSTNSQLCHNREDPVRGLLTPDLQHSYQRLMDSDEEHLLDLWWDITMDWELKREDPDEDSNEQQKKLLRISASKAVQSFMGVTEQKEYRMKELLEGAGAGDEAEMERKRAQEAEDLLRREEGRVQTAKLLNLLRPSQRSVESVSSIRTRMEKAQTTLGSLSDLVLHLDAWMTDIYKTFARPARQCEDQPRRVRACQPQTPGDREELKKLLDCAPDDQVPYCVARFRDAGGVAMTEIVDLILADDDWIPHDEVVTVLAEVHPRTVNVGGLDFLQGSAPGSRYKGAWYRIRRHTQVSNRSRLSRGLSQLEMGREDTRVSAHSGDRTPRRGGAGSPTARTPLATNRSGVISMAERDAEEDDVYIEARFVTTLAREPVTRLSFRPQEHRGMLPPPDWEAGVLGKL